MPIEHAHDSDRNLLIVTMSGDIADADLVAYARELVGDTSIQPGTNDYVDLSQVSSISATGEGVRRFDEILREGGRAEHPGRMAIFAPTDISFGMARMFELVRGESPVAVRVFRLEHEARRWLGLPTG